MGTPVIMETNIVFQKFHSYPYFKIVIVLFPYTR